MVVQEEWMSDPRNHCVPVTKVFEDHKNPEVSYMVMPFLRPVDTPPFEYVKEIIDFTDQILEVSVNYLPTFALDTNIPRVWNSSTRKGSHIGTDYNLGFHQTINRYHRDCVLKNLMMDADAMYPEGFHAVGLDFKPDHSGFAKYTSRSAVGVKYYFVDFGISVHIPESMSSKLVTGFLGRDRDPPELSDEIPYDPFKLDIFIIGNMLKHEFYMVGVHFNGG